jgi:hypothetical protein
MITLAFVFRGTYYFIFFSCLGVSPGCIDNSIYLFSTWNFSFSGGPKSCSFCRVWLVERSGKLGTDSLYILYDSMTSLSDKPRVDVFFYSLVSNKL